MRVVALVLAWCAAVEGSIREVPGPPPARPPPPPPKKPPPKDPIKKRAQAIAVESAAGKEPWLKATGFGFDSTPAGMLARDGGPPLYSTGVSRVYAARLVNNRNRDIGDVMLKYATDCAGRGVAEEGGLPSHPLMNEYLALTGVLQGSNVSVPGQPYLSPGATLVSGAGLAGHIAGLEADMRACARLGAQVRFLVTPDWGVSVEDAIGVWSHGVDTEEAAAVVAGNVLRLGLRVLEKVKKLHELGLMHGGLTDKSIRVGLDRAGGLGGVRLVDFEYTKPIDLDDDNELAWDTRMDPLWMSVPELEKKPPHARHDLFRLVELIARLLSRNTWGEALERAVRGDKTEDNSSRDSVMNTALEFKTQNFWFRYNEEIHTEAMTGVKLRERGAAQGVLESMMETLADNDLSLAESYAAMRNSMSDAITLLAGE